MPGLAADFGEHLEDGLAPALSLWLARARDSAFAPGWCEQAIAELCGNAAGLAPPVAALTYEDDFGAPPPAGACLRADPVHLRADTRGLLLYDAAAVAFDDRDAAQALVQTLDQHLAADDWQLVWRHPRRWYLLGPQAPQLHTAPLPSARGGPVAAMPYRGEQAQRWSARVNELQMLMHNHPVNLQRAQRGLPALNSVWLWGEGEWRSAGDMHYTHVVADTPFARGIAQRCGRTCLDVPAQADALLAELPAHADVLVVREDCRDAAAYDDAGAWLGALQVLQRDWFAPLLDALRRGQVDALELLPVNGRRYRLTRAALRAFWRGRGDWRRQPGFRLPDKRAQRVQP